MATYGGAKSTIGSEHVFSLEDLTRSAFPSSYHFQRFFLFGLCATLVLFITTHT
jgi:hypothetical protein